MSHPLSTRGVLARLSAVFVLGTASACTGDATAPLVAAPQDQDVLAHRQSRRLHEGKYRERRSSHGRGRSGDATLAARALLGTDGVTRLLVTTGSVEDPDRAPGELSKVQIKGYSPSGIKLFTRNYQNFTDDGSYEFRLYGLPRGTRIEVQANVRGINWRRTDVVEVTTFVLGAPVLGISLDAPSEVVAGVPTVITGTVRETGGDVGNYTICALYVDGRLVDRIPTVWVDGGDAVTCAFTHAFTQGSHSMVMRLERERRDCAPWRGLPSSTVQVTAVRANPVPTWTASVMDRTVELSNRYDEYWTRPDGMTRVHNQDNGEAPRTQNLSVVGSVARAMSFPLAKVELDARSDAGPWHDAVWNGLLAAPSNAQGQSCVDQIIPDQGAHFYLCTTGSGSQGITAFGYTRFAGTVTYHSVVFGRQWDNLAGETLWGWNNVSETYNGGGQMRPLGTAVSVRLEVTDAVGAIAVNASVPLSSFDSTAILVPYACQELFPYWLEGGVQRICEGSTQRTFGWSGEAAG